MQMAIGIRGDWGEVTVFQRGLLHYLRATGTPRRIDYGKFLKENPTGVKLLRRILEDVKQHITVFAGSRTEFSVSSEIYQVGGEDHTSSMPKVSDLYPNTVNWQRAIGGYLYRVSGDAVAFVDSLGGAARLACHAKLIVHVEDM